MALLLVVNALGIIITGSTLLKSVKIIRDHGLVQMFFRKSLNVRSLAIKIDYA